MASSLIVRIVLALMLACFPCRALSVDQQRYLGAGGIPYEVRDANLDDANDIADVMIDASSPSASYKYIHQFRHQYPGYDRRCMRATVRKMLTGQKFVWRVLSIPDKTADRGSRVVSISMWDFRGSANETFWSIMAAAGEGGNDECSKRLDVNATREADQAAKFAVVHKTYIDDAYESQAYLAGLATHPNWDGNGFAGRLVRWGLDRAREKGLPATLISSPAGYPLYLSFGYENIKNVSIELLDGLGSVWCEVMLLSSP